MTLLGWFKPKKKVGAVIHDPKAARQQVPCPHCGTLNALGSFHPVHGTDMASCICIWCQYGFNIQTVYKALS